MKEVVRKQFKKIIAAIGLLSVELIIILVLFVIALFGFFFLVNWVFRLDKSGFDFAVFQFVKPYITQMHTSIMEAFTFLGTHIFLIPANLVLIAYFLFVRKHRWYSIKIPVVSLGSLLMMTGLKHFFSRPRPDNPILTQVSGFSFPSGHAMVSFTFYGLLIYLVHQHIKKSWLKWTLIVLLSMLILIIGASRIYLRVHYATDVLAGYSLGLIWLVISITVIRRIEKYTLRAIVPVVEEKKVPSPV